ncbi:MAG TPA: MFS transporter [Actinocatenispora sp.]
MSLTTEATSVTRRLVLIRVVNRLGAFAMGFLSLRLTHDLGASLHLAGIVLAAFGVATIPSRLLGGLIANRYGARAALLTGLTTCAAAQLVIAVAPSLPAVVAGALLLGLAYEIVEPATQALVAQGVPADRRAGSYALLGAALAVAGVAAGVLAAVLTRWSVGALFVADAATSLLAAGVAVRLPANRVRTDARTAWRAVRSGRLAAWTALGCGYATLTMLVVFMLPLTIQAAGHRPSVTGWLLAAAAAAAIGAQRVVVHTERRLAPATMLTLGYALLALGTALWATGSLPALVAGAVLEGASGSLLLGTQQAVASRLAPPGGAASVLAVYGLSWGVGTVVAPLVGTPLLARGPGPLWLTCAASAAAFALGAALHRAAARRRQTLRAAEVSAGA